MGTIIYKPHCGKCGAIINQKVRYREIDDEIVKNRLYGGYYIDIEPNRDYQFKTITMEKLLKFQCQRWTMGMTIVKNYAVYLKNGKYWRADKELHTLKSAKEMVKGLKTNGEKAFFSKVR